jgi:hypothetical protein
LSYDTVIPACCRRASSRLTKLDARLKHSGMTLLFLFINQLDYSVSEKGRMMLDTRIILAGVWVALVLVYLYGDVLRIFSGDVARMGGTLHFTQAMWLGIAVLMLIPILMVPLSLALPHDVNRWANIIVAVFFFLFNLVGLPTYPSAYDKFLIIVGLLFNVVTVWMAWNWA